MSNLKSSRISRCVSHLYPGLVSSASRSQDSCTSPFNVLSLLHPRPENANQLNPGPYQTHSGLRMCASPPAMSCLTNFQVPKFLSHLHPCTDSLPSRSKDSNLTFIHVQFHFRLGNYIGISPPSIHVSHTTRTEFCVSSSSRSHLTDM